MVTKLITLCGSSSNSIFHKQILQRICSTIKLKLARFSSTSTSAALYEYPIEENDDLQSNKGHEVLKNCYDTYLEVLDGCLEKGSLTNAKTVQARLLKLGFGSDNEIRNRMLDIYVTREDLGSALRVFDDFPHRNVSFWNKLLFHFVGKKLSTQVFELFTRMINEDLEVDEDTFAYVLRACSGCKISFHSVEKIHAQVIHYGFDTSRFVCNPLIDLYSRNKCVLSAKQIFDGLVLKDSVSWVAMISGFSQNSREKDAILLYKEMCTLAVIPTPYIFSSIISACTKIEYYNLGKQLHASIYKRHFSSEIFICNALLTLYSRYGNLLSADQIFSDMNRKDEVTYNSLISGLAHQGFNKKALELFEKMQIDSLKPDSVTVASLLSACASLGAISSGKQLHSYATKTGMCSDIIIEGSLLDLYVKCLDLEMAQKLFVTTRKENVVLWNVMLVAYGQKGNLDESFRIFTQMQSEGLEPNQYTYPSILRTCTSMGALDLGEQIHTQVIKNGFQLNVFVCSVLIDMYTKHKKLDNGLKILRRINEKDLVSWTAMISGYTQHDLFTEALKLFEEMVVKQGIRSDNIGLSSAISACAGIQAINQGRQVHAQSIVSGYSWDLSIGNALVCLYARCGKIQDAYKVFENITEKDKITWNGLISGFSQSGLYEEALKVFSRMNQAQVGADMFTYGSAVSAAANMTNIKQGKQIHAKIIKNGYNSEIEVSNVLITLYSKCGSLEEAKIEFLEMVRKNEVSWNAMITGYSQHGCGNEAINLFKEMEKQGIKPNYVTFVGVLSACSHVGLVEEGINYFKSMTEEHGLVPKPEHYVCVVDILGRAGELKLAQDFIKEMPIKPDAMVWRTLLSACTVYKNVEIGDLAAKNLLKLEPRDSATYVLLSNMYAVSGKWKNRDETRKLMKERGVKKETGRSWIEIKNCIHAFFVGDRLHSLSDKIYEFLQDLNKRVGEIGYVQDRNSLWNDVELEGKDMSAYVHSEKLAIVFGLMSLSERIPLRVMKNLRVCNDCHNWIKFVSRVENRAIVVRDAYRFHHFENGACSCKDYW